MAIQKYINAFDSEYKTVAKSIVAELQRLLLNTPADKVESVIVKVLLKYKIDKKLRDALLKSVVGAVQVGVGTSVDIESNIAVQKWFLDKIHTVGINMFSKAVNDLSRFDEMKYLLHTGMRLKESVQLSAVRLAHSGIVNGDIAEDIQKVVAGVKKLSVLAEDPKLSKKFNSDLRRVQSRIATLERPSTSKLKRAYQDIIELSSNATNEAIEKVVERAVLQKARSNAERIAATEIARAYGDAVFTDAAHNDDVIGVRSILSSAHGRYDICDFYADSDLYGMGAGVFPKDHAPPFPYHPYCTCILDNVYTGEANPGKFNPNKADSFIHALPANKKQELLGKRGAERFNKKESAWDDELNNYQPHESKGITIPVKKKTK
jgi:hypothetical protein